MTAQQERVLIALTRDYPRTIDGMGMELGLPSPSIRRVISELRYLGVTVDTRKVPDGPFKGIQEYTLGSFDAR